MSATQSANPGSPLLHIPIAIGFQAAFLGLATLAGIAFSIPLLWIFSLPGLIWCLSRESTQYEYQYIQTHGGLRANMPALTGLKFWKWNTHSIRETLLAALSVAVISAAATIYWR